MTKGAGPKSRALCWPVSVLARWPARPVLREDFDDDAAVLRAAVAGVVRRNRLLFAVADHVDLVQRNLVLLIQITLHGFGAGEAEALVHLLVAGVVGVAFDLDPHGLLVGLELVDHVVERRGGVVRQVGLPELELAAIFTQYRFEDQLAGFGFDARRARFRGAPDFRRLVGGVSGSGVRLGRRFTGSRRLGVGLGNAAFRLAHALLG